MFSNSGVNVAPLVTVGQQEFTTPGSYSWTAPAGVTSVCAVCVGPGGKTSSSTPGGGLGWKNNIPVTPGQTYTVQVGNYTLSTHSFFISSTTVAGNAPTLDSKTGGTFVGDGGGNGGNAVAGGGGAGGYAGNGGNGGNANSSGGTGGTSGTGGAGGGGGGTFVNPGVAGGAGGGGGGVGLKGQGTSGTGGGRYIDGSTPARGGTGGSGGTNGGDAHGSIGYDAGAGGMYGAGSGQQGSSETDTGIPAASSNGAVRLIWGPGRAFPSTNTGDM